MHTQEYPAPYLEQPTRATRVRRRDFTLRVLAPSVLPAPDGDTIGPYRLIRELGRGGMGVVHLAERVDERGRVEVALKVLRRGIEGGDAEQRFAAERRILSTLHHPNIARVLDGGITADGRPYFVMEHVDGAPIDEWCDARRLPVEARLRLFGQVARAVQHAHRSLVVHRDLKPANILVTSDGEVKLVDFGIAKLLDPALADVAPATRTGVFVMTPEYAAPEQVLGAPITTATDVYALGLLLHELLCGRRAQEVPDQSLAGLFRAIVHREPLPPSRVAERESARDAQSADSAVVYAAARSTTPARLRRRLQGDLDRIVAAALAKEPARRYASAEQMAEDVERHLARRPVLARGDSRGYRVRRFVARNRWKVAGCGAFALLLTSYTATVSVQARRIREEGAKATQVTSFLLDVFGASEPGTAQGREVTALELLHRGARRAEQLAEEPEVQATLLTAMGRVYQGLGAFDDGERSLRRALELRLTTKGDEDAAVAESWYRLGDLLLHREQHAAAESLFTRALAVQRKRFGVGDTAVARTLVGLSYAAEAGEDFQKAERLAREALAIRERALGPWHPDVAESLNFLAGVLRARGHDVEALFRRTLEIRRRTLGAAHPLVGQSANNMAVLLLERGRFAEGEAMLQEALANWRRAYPSDHPQVAVGLANLAKLRNNQGRFAESETLYRQALAINRARYGAEHPQTIATGASLGSALRRLGRHAEAESLLTTAADPQRNGRGAVPLATARLNLAQLYHQRGEHGRALSLLRLAEEGMRQALGDHHPSLAVVRVNLGRTLAALGQLAEAESLVAPALAQLASRTGDHPNVAGALAIAGDLRMRQRRFAEADSAYTAAAAMVERMFGPSHPDRMAALEGRSRVAEARGHTDR